LILEKEKKKKEKQQHEPWRYNNVIALGIFSLWCYLKNKTKKYRTSIQLGASIQLTLSDRLRAGSSGALWLHYTFDCIYHRSPMWIACYQALDEHVQKSVPISKTVKRFFFFNFFFKAIKCDCSWLLN
jgi:hypothetical protein